jgi:hypothetical protein
MKCNQLAINFAKGKKLAINLVKVTDTHCYREANAVGDGLEMSPFLRYLLSGLVLQILSPLGKIFMCSRRGFHPVLLGDQQRLRRGEMSRRRPVHEGGKKEYANL